MGRLGSGKTKGSVFPGVFDVKLGTYTGELVGLQIYHSDNFKDKNKLDLCLGFTVDIDDPDAEHEPQENGLYRHTEGFVRLQVDDEGNFGPGGAKAKAYKLMSAYFGEDFNAFDDDFEWWFEFPDGVEFMSIDDIPHHKSYQQDEEWQHLDDIIIKANGKERGIMGEKAMLKFGYAQKPDGTYSDKITIIEALALPRSNKGAAKRKAQPAKKAAAKQEEAPAPAAAQTQAGANKTPRYVEWVWAKAMELEINPDDFQPWFEHFLREKITSPESFSKEQAKTFKTAYENDSDQILQSYNEWLAKKGATADDGGEFPPDPDEDFWGDDEEAEVPA